MYDLKKIENKGKVKVVLDNKEIGFFIISLENGKILESGDENQDTWTDTYVDLKSIEEDKPLKISFNKEEFDRRFSKKEPVWVDMNYKSLEIFKIR